MHVNAQRCIPTQRIVRLNLTAHSAADELLLTELLNVISKPNYAENITINYPDSDPRASMIWTPSELNSEPT